MTLLEKLAEARENLANVKTAVESGEKSADELAEAIECVKTAQKNIDAADEAESIMKSLASPKEEKADMEEKKMEYKNLGEFVAHEVKEAGIDGKERFAFTSPEFKAAAPMTKPSSMADGLTTYDLDIVEGFRRPLLIRDLFAAETISNAALTFYVESTTVEGGPAFTTEGTEKPLTSFGDPTAKTVSLAKIAAHLKESEEILEDAPRLASAIQARLVYLQQLAVENYLVSSLSGTSGIGTASLLTPDGIFKAMMTVQTTTGFAADAIVINPADYQNIRLRKDNNGQYYGGGFMYGQYGNGAIAEQPALWGVRTVLTPAVSQGTCYVGAFRLGGSVVTKNSGMRVEIANQNEDDFIKNMITIRTEERIALAVRYPGAFVKISGSSTSTEA